MVTKRTVFLGILILIAAVSGFSLLFLHPSPSSTPPVNRTVPAAHALRVAVIGDYGWGTPAERKVADLVHALTPDLILTVGDARRA